MAKKLEEKRRTQVAEFHTGIRQWTNTVTLPEYVVRGQQLKLPDCDRLGRVFKGWIGGSVNNGVPMVITLWDTKKRHFPEIVTLPIVVWNGWSLHLPPQGASTKSGTMFVLNGYWVNPTASQQVAESSTLSQKLNLLGSNPKAYAWTSLYQTLDYHGYDRLSFLTDRDGAMDACTNGCLASWGKLNDLHCGYLFDLPVMQSAERMWQMVCRLPGGVDTYKPYNFDATYAQHLTKPHEEDIIYLPWQKKE